jgi:4-hydroxybenzoate polyprenyltransferase
MIHFLKLVRFQNLMIIALTQYLFRYAILIPIMKLEQVTPAFGNISFALLVLSTVLVAAAGYAINDYFDIRNDRINKPKKIIIGKHISRRVAMMTHTVFSIIAVLIGAYVSYKAGSIKLTVINIVMVSLLWMYSLKFKAYFLVGNILVSFSTAMTILLVWIYDMYALRSSQQYILTYLNLLNFFLWAYTLFAFFISMVREIIKDIEDIEGDKKCGCSTIPVVIGIKRTKYILYLILAAAVTALSYISYKAHQQQALQFLFWYLIIAVIIPILYMGYIVVVAKNKDDYSYLSSITKFIMLSGVLSMILIFFRF